MKRKNEANEIGIDVFNIKGVDKKLNNLLTFDDFEKSFKFKEQKVTKRTDVGLDILNEWNNPFKRVDSRISEILRVQGTEMDQRDDRDRIYTKEELEEMDKERLSDIYHQMCHPRGRDW